MKTSTSKVKTKVHWDSGDCSILKNIPFDGHITKHFTWEEYSNPSSGEDIIAEVWPESLIHARIIEDFRNDYYEKNHKGCVANSWYRTEKFNARPDVNGAKKSLHLWGCATDLLVGPPTDAEWKWYIDEVTKLGKKYDTQIELGRYDWGIHIGSHIEVWNPYTDLPVYLFDYRKNTL